MVDRATKLIPVGNALPTPGGTPELGEIDISESTRRFAPYTIVREIRITREEPVNLRREGALLVGELDDILLIMPTENLNSRASARRFSSDLLRHAGEKPFIIIDLNFQGYVHSDYLTGPLVDLNRACSGRSRIFVATENKHLRDKFTRMSLDRIWIIVERGQDAIEIIDNERFLAERAAEKRSP